jgi:hypothetical protein
LTKEAAECRTEKISRKAAKKRKLLIAAKDRKERKKITKRLNHRFTQILVPGSGHGADPRETAVWLTVSFASLLLVDSA